MKMIGGRKLFAAAVGALALTVMGQVPAAKAESLDLSPRRRQRSEPVRFPVSELG